MRRAGELVARYGGEEFMVVASDANLERAQQLAESIRAGIADAAIAHPTAALGIVTASIGVVARVPQRGEQSDRFVTEADEALYRAKQAGRNRVESVG